MKHVPSRLLLSALGLAAFAIVAVKAEAAPQTVFHLTIVNQKFEPDTLTVPAGQALKIMVKNNDAIPAEFESGDLKREVVIPGKTELPVHLRPLEPGTYSFLNDFHPSSKGSLIVKKED